MAFREYKVADAAGKEVLTVVASTTTSSNPTVTAGPLLKHIFVRFPDGGAKPTRIRGVDYYPAEWFKHGLNAAMFNIENVDQLFTALTSARDWLRSEGVE